jgi:hypothetical protein
LRFPARTAAQILGAAQNLGAWLGPLHWWLLAGAVLGVVPLGFEAVTELPVSRLVTAILLAPLLAAAVARDALGRGVGVVLAAFLSHALLAIALFASDGDRLRTLFPDGAAYWQETHQWLVTGQSREYELSWWVPAHVQLLGSMALFTYTSLGFLTFWQGLYEVDLMNGYVGQLLRHSDNPATALALGWHPWSLCRGAGYLFLTFEIASLSLTRLTGVPLSTRKRQRRRWVMGFSLLVLDGLLKFWLLEPVRRILAANLL